MTERCETCKYYFPYFSKWHGDEKIYERGKCRNQPPTVFGSPIVEADDWCGWYNPNAEAFAEIQRKLSEERKEAYSTCE